MHHSFSSWLLFTGILAGSVGIVLSDDHPHRIVLRRAQPPKWSGGNTKLFFHDAFSESLQGKRPEGFGRSAKPDRLDAKSVDRDSESDASTKYFWSKVISAATIEDEVKVIKQAVDKAVTTPGAYRGGGFKEGRQHFSVLAFLFAIVVEYDTDIRWKQHAAAARDLFARAGKNSKTGTNSAYQEAKQRKDDLQDLVGGASVAASSNQEEVTWEAICDRPPLMRRMKVAHQDRVSIWTANRVQFRKHSDELIREAEIIAAIAWVIQKEGFEYWDDEDYVGYCNRLKQHSLELVSAVKSNNMSAARTAAGEIDKTCSECHEGYQ